MTTTKTKATATAVRTSARRTTASSRTTSGTTRTTSSSQCTTSTPMTTLTSTIAWCTSCVESVHRAHCFTPDDDTGHLMAQVLSNHIVISMSSMTRSLWLDLSHLPLLVLLALLRLLPLSRAVPWARQPDRHGKSAPLRRRREWGHPELFHLSHKTWGTRICCRLRSVNAHDQQKDWVMLKWILWRNRAVLTANGELQTHEEATVYVKELDIILSMKVLENTPAVLSLGKLCDENGYSYELINGQKPHLIWNGIRIQCNTENFVSDRGSRLVNKFFLQFSTFNFNDTFKTGESLFYIFFKLVFVTDYSNIKWQWDLEKERIKVKLILLQCLCQVQMLMIELGNPLFAVKPITSKPKPSQNSQKQIKRRPW